MSQSNVPDHVPLTSTEPHTHCSLCAARLQVKDQQKFSEEFRGTAGLVRQDVSPVVKNLSPTHLYGKYKMYVTFSQMLTLGSEIYTGIYTALA